MIIFLVCYSFYMASLLPYYCSGGDVSDAEFDVPVVDFSGKASQTEKLDLVRRQSLDNILGLSCLLNRPLSDSPFSR